MTNRILLTIAFITGSLYSGAQPVLLNSAGKVNVNGQLSYWRDETSTLTLNDVKNKSFAPLQSASSPNIGFDRAAHWFKLEIANVSEFPQWLMEIAYAPLDQIDFYVEGSDSASIHKVSGDHYPISQRDVRHRHPVFSFHIQKGQSAIIYLRVQSISSVQVPLTFWNRDGFLKTAYNIQLLNGLFYGAMFLMIFYQLFLFFAIKDKITFYYVLTLLTMVNVVAFFQGYSFLYLYPENPAFNDILAMITGPFFVICSTFLTREFLNLRQFSKLLDKLLLGNMFLDISILVVMTIFFRKISYQYHNYLIFVHCVLVLVCAGYCLYNKYKPARYYLLAWFSPLMAALAFTLSSTGFLSGELSTNYMGIMAGCILQVLFISLALGDRWRTLEIENQRAKELEFNREHEEKERLEKEVKLRTTEIQQQNIELEEVNRVKDKLFSVVSHDIKGPLSSLHLALTLAKTGALSSAEFQELSTKLELRLGQTSEFIDNLLQWAKLQMNGETFEPDKVDLIKLSHESAQLIEPECQQKKIVVKNNLMGALDAFADLNMMRSVFRNLLTNAVKFTRPEGTITINAYRVDNKIIISVSDTGIGIPDSNRDGLFTLNSITTEGTRQEKGTGLGLLLCKEFVEKNNGRIWFETEEQKGTTFYFSLPRYMEKPLIASANS